MITLSLNIGSLIGILGLATFICDIVALYVHRQSNVYRQQKFQDVDLNLVQLETLNSLPLAMMSEDRRRKFLDEANQNHQKPADSAYERFSPVINNNYSRKSAGKNIFGRRDERLTGGLFADLSPTSLKQRRSMPDVSPTRTPPVLKFDTPIMNATFIVEEGSPKSVTKDPNGSAKIETFL